MLRYIADAGGAPEEYLRESSNRSGRGLGAGSAGAVFAAGLGASENLLTGGAGLGASENFLSLMRKCF